MTKFTYDEMVRVSSNAEAKCRPGEKAWIVGVFQDRPKGRHFESFPTGVVYMIEFQDGEAIDIHESFLEEVEW